MYRTYQPYTPVTNVYLKQRWDQIIFKNHRKKVRAAMAVIDICPPKVHMHLQLKLKKLQKEATNLSIIENENRLLLDKMRQIIMMGGRIDNENNYESKSLNMEKRKRELIRVLHENMEIDKRITARNPNFSTKKLLMDWQMNQKYLRNISKYPPPKNNTAETNTTM